MRKSGYRWILVLLSLVCIYYMVLLFPYRPRRADTEDMIVFIGKSSCLSARRGAWVFHPSNNSCEQIPCTINMSGDANSPPSIYCSYSPSRCKLFAWLQRTETGPFTLELFEPGKNSRSSVRLPDENLQLIAGYNRQRNTIYVEGRDILAGIHLSRKAAHIVKIPSLFNTPLGAGMSRVAVCNGNEMQLVDVADGKVVNRIQGLQGEKIALSPDGSKIACFDADGKVVVASTGDGAHREDFTIPQYDGARKRLAWSPDGRYLACEVAGLVFPPLLLQVYDSVLYIIDVDARQLWRLPVYVDHRAWNWCQPE